MSAFRGEADTAIALRDVRFWPIAVIRSPRQLLRWFEALLLLRDFGCARRPHGGDLDNHLTVLCPCVVRRLRRLGIKRARGIGLELAFVPLFANAEIKRSG